MLTSVGVSCAAAIAASVAVARRRRPRRGGRPRPTDDALVKKARAIHDKVIALDTHVDINPHDFTAERNYTQRLDTQVNLPKMVEGGLDAVFLIVYVGQPSLQTTPDAFEPAGYERAYKSAVEKFDADPPADREDRARPHRAGADRGGRPPHQRQRQEGRADRRRERLSDRHRHRRGSRSSTTAARATCRWRTTATASCPTRTPARPKAGSGTACRRSASR